MALFPRIAEQRMQEAADDGAFDDLPGAGAPIPDLQSRDGLDPVTRAGYRIMSEAGAVPLEVALRNALREARAALKTITDPEEKARAMARVAELDMRYGLAMDQRRRGR